ncbi:hypothetical protein MBCUT_06490 [Methanobrevibacter cuticularis]|uniref:Uncharacterized protein n=1 Tax=Methanobrevibacter cuticularis TaxID=47311 RepID=A0A166EG12_9EURY|nr:hypothetical protein [Methanobrevibacter cuticularis]KZX16611.1 hypothetical protein MBCUT_06490 [Methanobrevibacter cuticularis]
MNKAAIADFQYKVNSLNQYEIADEALNKIFKKLEAENNGLLYSQHYPLEGGDVDQYGNYYRNQIKINKEGSIFLSAKHIGEICNDTQHIGVEEFIKTGGDLEELTNTIFQIASDIAEAQKVTTHGLDKFIITLEALL